MKKKVVVGYHGHCFDGMCSAAAFTRLLRELADGELDVSYRGLDHQPGGSHVPDDVLAGEVNGVVDFRYTVSPKLSWWFDHHVSGIANDEERAHFEQDSSGQKFFDPGYGSCCKLIADVARDRFSIALGGLEDMVYWADIIDAARFPDARTAVELEAPALRLMTVVEAYGDDKFLAPRIEALATGAGLSELAGDAATVKLFAPLEEQHRKTLEEIRAKGRLEQGVMTFDLVGSGRERYNKFIPYYLEPASRYCVAVTASRSRAKISVGSNPWAPVPRTHNIAEICARYGGGGHPVVGAVSLPASEIEKAREIAREIVAELGRD